MIYFSVRYSTLFYYLYYNLYSLKHSHEIFMPSALPLNEILLDFAGRLMDIPLLEVALHFISLIAIFLNCCSLHQI